MDLDCYCIIDLIIALLYYGFACIITFDWYLFQLIVLLKPDFNYFNGFSSSWADKVTTGTYRFVSDIVNTVSFTPLNNTIN